MGNKGWENENPGRGRKYWGGMGQRIIFNVAEPWARPGFNEVERNTRGQNNIMKRRGGKKNETGSPLKDEFH